MSPRAAAAGVPFKHVALLAATAAAFGISLLMIRQAVGLASPWVGLMLMLDVLGLAKVAEPIVTLRMPAGLRRIRPWEIQGTLYRRLAVPAFGNLLRHTPLRLLNTSVYVTPQRGPGQVLRLIEAAEASHFYAALVLVPWFLLYLASAGAGARWALLAGLLLVEILGNAYPVMHLRWVRGRMERVTAARAASC